MSAFSGFLRKILFAVMFILIGFSAATAGSFQVNTTNIAAGGKFRFVIQAAGKYTISWGDGQTDTVTVSHNNSDCIYYHSDIVINGATPECYSNGQYVDAANKINEDLVVVSHTYSSGGSRTITIANDLGTLGLSNYPEYDDGGTIYFGNCPYAKCTGNTADKVSSITGSLGSVFWTRAMTSNSQDPMFNDVFNGCVNLTGIDENLFGSQVTSAHAGMFVRTFEGSGLSGTIPEGLFRYIYGHNNGGESQYNYMFKRTFAETAVSVVPEKLFWYRSSAPHGLRYSGTGMFEGTFEGCTSLFTLPTGMFRHIGSDVEDGKPRPYMFKRTFANSGIGTGEILGYGPAPVTANLFPDGAAKGLYYQTFAECSEMRFIDGLVFPVGSASSADLEKLFYETFAGCSRLATITASPFSITGSGTETFFGTFRNSGLSGTNAMPAGLFSNYTGGQRGFQSVFEGCSSLRGVPYALFNNITTSAQRLFAGSFKGSGLQSIDNRLFSQLVNGAPYMFFETFSNCDNLGAVPANLFRIWGIYEHGFDRTFAGCDMLNSVANNMFASGTNVQIVYNGGAYAFTGMFQDCPSLHTVDSFVFPLVHHYTNGMYKATFKSSGLTTVPSGLFRAANKETREALFESTFENCQSLATVPSMLFSGLVVSQDSNNNNGLFLKTFANSGLSMNFSQLGGDFFRLWTTPGNAAIGESMFEGTFKGCSGLTGQIPRYLFAHLSGSGGRDAFKSTFEGCSNLTGIEEPGLFVEEFSTASGLFDSTFKGCTRLSSVPSSIFDKVVGSTIPSKMFKETFANCSNLETVPSSMFENFTSMSSGVSNCSNNTNYNYGSFYKTFENCTKLTGYIDENVINQISTDTGGDPWTPCGVLDAMYDMFLGTTQWNGTTGMVTDCASVGRYPGTGNCATMSDEAWYISTGGNARVKCCGGKAVSTITLNNNGATSAGTTALWAKYGVGVYLDPEATSNPMTPQSQNGGSNPITKPQKQFTVNYNAQGGNTANLTNSNKTATFTFGGYRDRDYESVIDADGYITSGGNTMGQSYVNDTTWVASWSGGSVTLPSAQRPGWRLLGWKTSGNCQGLWAGTPGQSYTPGGNTMLYACWTNVPYYTITLNDGPYNDISQHGYISSTDSNQCTAAGIQYGNGWMNICNASPQVGDSLSLRQIPKRPNHVFNGYWAELAGGASGVDTQIVTKDGVFLDDSEILNGFVSDASIGADWQPKYLITLNPNGGNNDGDASVYEGYRVGWSKTQNGDYTETRITTPTRTGYSFAGYYDDPDYGTKYIWAAGTLPAPTTFTSPKTLYAHWAPKRYTITLDDNGGSGGQVGDASAHCTTATLVYGVGWENGCSSGGGGGVVYDRGASGSGEGDKTESGESGGEKSASSSSNTSSGGLYLYPTTGPTRDGYTFDGYWDTASGQGTRIVTPGGGWFIDNDPNVLTFTSQNATIYARWISGTPSNTIYTITLNPNNNGLDGNRPPKIYVKGSHFWADSTATDYPITGSVFDPVSPNGGGAGITRPTPPIGKAFDGYWWDRMTERFTDSDGHIVPNPTNFTADATVNGHWDDAATTTVTLDPNGGTACATTSVTATQGHDMPTLTCGPAAPTGYDFTGYYRTADGGRKYYDVQLASANVWDQTTSTATIYAGYEPAVRDITYQCTAGTDSFVDTATYGSEYTILDFDDVGCSAIAGKKFIGWTISGTNTFLDPGTPYQNWPYYTDLTLVAKYLDIYTVSLRHHDATNNPRPTVAYVIPYTSDSHGYQGWYRDATADTPLVTMNPVPQRGALYLFAGYFYSTQSDEIQIVDENGVFLTDQGTLESITADVAADAHWKIVSPEFMVATILLPANTTFRFYIGAAGEFVITWGDEQSQTVSSPGIVSHTYSNTGYYTIGIVGDATSYTNAYTGGTIYNTGRVAESTQWSNNTTRPTQLNFPAAIRFGCEAGDSSCTLTPQLIASVSGSLGDVFPTLGTGNTNQPRFSRTFAGCTNLASVPEGLFEGVYGPAVPGMFYGTFENSGVGSVGQNLFSGITAFAPHVFQRTFMGSNLANASMYLFGRIAGAPAEAMFAYTFANTKLSGIPSDMFGGVAGTPAQDMFWGTFSGVSTLSGSIPSGLFGGMAGAPAKGMFDSTFYECYNLTGTIPANLFGGTGLLGAPAERMFAGTFYDCYYLGGTIPANLFGGAGLSGASAVEMFDTTFYACGSLSGYVPMTLFGGISTSNPATNMMNHVFQNSGVWSSCPCGTHDYTTGFESYWDTRVSCEVGLKPNEHWYGNICVEDCAAGITQIRTSTGLSFQILKTKPTDHAIYVSAPNDGTVCYVPLDSGAASGSINVSLNGSAYHTGSVSSNAPSGWDPLTAY